MKKAVSIILSLIMVLCIFPSGLTASAASNKSKNNNEQTMLSLRCTDNDGTVYFVHVKKITKKALWKSYISQIRVETSMAKKITQSKKGTTWEVKTMCYSTKKYNVFNAPTKLYTIISNDKNLKSINLYEKIESAMSAIAYDNKARILLKENKTVDRAIANYNSANAKKLQKEYDALLAEFKNKYDLTNQSNDFIKDKLKGKFTVGFACSFESYVSALKSTIDLCSLCQKYVKDMTDHRGVLNSINNGGTTSISRIKNIYVETSKLKGVKETKRKVTI